MFGEYALYSFDLFLFTKFFFFFFFLPCISPYLGECSVRERNVSFVVVVE